MLQVKTKVKENYPDRRAPATSVAPPRTGDDSVSTKGIEAIRPPRTPAPPQSESKQPQFPVNRVTESRDLQTRVPAIIGEATYRGTIQVEGVINGQPGTNGGSLSIRQHCRSFFGNERELNGEIRFRDMLRVNGHVAGSICSQKGTLIVDINARIDAHIEVAIAVIGGTVTGDIVGHQRVELQPTAKIHGNIWTRSLAIQRGAIFEGVCQMIEDNKDNTH